MSAPEHPLLRSRAVPAKVGSEELFFDLVYVFAVTQVSHYLLGHLTPAGALQTLLLWLAVWRGWQYTAWVTNWFDPATLPIRCVLFAVMGLALLMAAALPQAFGPRALLFAACYAAIQVGRSLWVLLALGRGHALAPNFRRILACSSVAAAFWIAGALADGAARLALWAIAVACEYASPMAGFAFPGLGRSRTSDWTIDGGHLAERCQLFVIVALGESILASGVALAHHEAWHGADLVAFAAAFVSSLAMWWMYFDTSSRAAAQVIEHAEDPGRVGARFHYTHVILVAGIIVSAVAHELLIAHAAEAIVSSYALVLLAGPAIYLAGNSLFKRAVYGRVPLSHAVGLALLALLAVPAHFGTVLGLGLATMLIMSVVAAWEALSRWRPAGAAAR